MSTAEPLNITGKTTRRRLGPSQQEPGLPGKVGDSVTGAGKTRVQREEKRSKQNRGKRKGHESQLERRPQPEARITRANQASTHVDSNNRPSKQAGRRDKSSSDKPNGHTQKK